jgi:hypothetical protein
VDGGVQHRLTLCLGQGCHRCGAHRGKGSSPPSTRPDAFETTYVDVVTESNLNSNVQPRVHLDSRVRTQANGVEVWDLRVANCCRLREYRGFHLRR